MTIFLGNDIFKRSSVRPGNVHGRFLSERSEQTRFGEGRKGQRGERPRISTLMNMNNLEIRSLI